jgi:hypothetical protein
VAYAVRPFFGNEVAVLTLDDARAQPRFEKAETGRDGKALLRTVFDGRLTGRPLTTA